MKRFMVVLFSVMFQLHIIFKMKIWFVNASQLTEILTQANQSGSIPQKFIIRSKTFQIFSE